jgi:hypothetical protein
VEAKETEHENSWSKFYKQDAIIDGLSFITALSIEAWKVSITWDTLPQAWYLEWQ